MMILVEVVVVIGVGVLLLGVELVVRSQKAFRVGEMLG